MKVLVTAGPTREFIDPVRFITNRSTGKMGYAIVSSALDRGHEVCLVSGPVCLEPPKESEFVSVVTAEEMLEAVKMNIGWCDVLIMTAAVADWRPSSINAEKIKKGADSLVLQLESTVDILGAVQDRKGTRLFVGFSADSENVVSEATRKLTAKHLDMIVANDISRSDAGFECDTNQVTVIERSGVEHVLPLMSKSDVATELIQLIEKMTA
jgi:phosphopantothenoylcysteine decarboxylase/phosphopantothenate--cysteine ligase